MSNRHTTGPWFFDREAQEITCKKRRGMAAIARVETGWAEPFESEQQANALLIATAPDLLMALKTARRELAAMHQAFIVSVKNQHTGKIDSAEDRAIARADAKILAGIDAAISKATGEQK